MGKPQGGGGFTRRGAANRRGAVARGGGFDRLSWPCLNDTRGGVQSPVAEKAAGEGRGEGPS